jgi:hypothetical protein
VVVGDFFFYFSDNIENVWFFIVVSVSTDTEIDLIFGSIIFIGDSSTKDRIGRSHGYVAENISV